jgi:hypothetical protein
VRPHEFALILDGAEKFFAGYSKRIDAVKRQVALYRLSAVKVIESLQNRHITAPNG